jgi:hypothetical protein
MTTKTWIDGSGNWNTAADWTTGSVPGPGDDAVIPSGAVSLTTPVTVGSISLTTSAAAFAIANPGGTDTVTGGLSNNGTVNIDPYDGSSGAGGSSLSIGGTLTNTSTGIFNIGYASNTLDSNVTAAGLSNAGTINLFGGNSAQAILDITTPAPATLTGSVSLSNSALLEFASGSVTTIANGATLTLSGAQARVAVAADTGSNSALTQLSNNAGSLILNNSASLATNADFLNSGNVDVENGPDLGWTFTVGGTLTNTGVFTIGGEHATSGSNLRAAGFSNTGTFNLIGTPSFIGAPGGAAIAEFAGSAPSTINGTLTLFGNAIMEFDGGGTISSIASGATLELDTWGAQPQLTALSGLTNNAGTLNLDVRGLGSATRPLNGNLNLAFDNTISNTGTINYGNPGVWSGNDLVTMPGLTNTGTLALVGGPFTVTLNILGAAPTTLTGDTYVGNNAVLQYGSGAITAIGSGAVLDLNGTGRLALNGQAGNSGLTQLALNAGGLHIGINGSIATAPGLDFSNTNFVFMDAGVFAVGGALNNSGIFTLQGSNPTVTAAAVNNSGMLGIGQFATLAVNSGHAFTQTGGSTTVNRGTLSADQVNIAGGSVLFQTPLLSSAHTGPITLSGGSLVEFAAAADSSEMVGFGGAGTIRLDAGTQFAGTIFHFTGFISSSEAVDIASLSDVNNDAFTSFNAITDQLTVFGDNGSVTLQLDAEDYSGVTWSVQRDAGLGTLVTASFVPGSQYVFFAPGQPINVATTTDPNNPPPPVPGDFNLELVVNATGTGSVAAAPGYQGLAIRSTDGHTVTLLHGDYGVVRYSRV